MVYFIALEPPYRSIYFGISSQSTLPPFSFLLEQLSQKKLQYQHVSSRRVLKQSYRNQHWLKLSTRLSRSVISPSSSNFKWLSLMLSKSETSSSGSIKAFEMCLLENQRFLHIVKKKKEIVLFPISYKLLNDILFSIKVTTSQLQMGLISR